MDLALISLPITIAYVGGTKNNKFKLLSFSGGIIFALITLGAPSGFLGKYMVITFYTSLVAILAIVMGLNLLGILRFQLPNIPNLEFMKDKVPSSITPFIIGGSFGFASSPLLLQC